MTQRERQVLQLIEADPLISQQDIAAKLGITRSSVAVHIANLTKKGCIAGRGYVLHAGTYAVVQIVWYNFKNGCFAPAALFSRPER